MSKKTRISRQFEAASEESSIPHGQGGVMARHLRDALIRRKLAITPRQWHNATMTVQPKPKPRP